MTPSKSKLSLSAFALAALLNGPAFGQDLGREGRLSYGVGFDYDFDDGFEAISDVALTLITRTRSETLEFQIGTELVGDYTDGGSNDVDFRNSSAGLVYGRENANSNLRFTARYSEKNLEDEIVDSILTDGGTETTTEFTGRYETGIEGPFGLRLDTRYRERSFTDADPDLTDDTLFSLDALARFGLSQNTNLRARAGIRQEDEGDAAGTERQTTYVGIGIGTETAGGLSVTGDLFFDDTETTTTAPPSTATEDGIGVELSVSQARRDGFVAASLSSRIDEAGRRTRADVTRSFDMRTGQLDVSLGVVDQEDADDLELVGSLNYTVETRSSVLSAELERDATTDDGETKVDTSLRLAYRRDINAVSGWETQLGYFASEELDGTDDNRTTASVTYRRDLTEEWSMRTGYAYSKDDDGDAENSVFFNIRRDITFGF